MYLTDISKFMYLTYLYLKNIYLTKDIYLTKVCI